MKSNSHKTHIKSITKSLHDYRLNVAPVPTDSSAFTKTSYAEPFTYVYTVANIDHIQLQHCFDLENILILVIFPPTVIAAGALTKSLGCRKTCLIGLSVTAVGMTLGMFSTNYYMFLLTFGVTKGVYVHYVSCPYATASRTHTYGK